MELRTLASLLADDFRWSFLAAYDRTSRGEAKGRSSSHSDPTGELVVDGVKEDAKPTDRPGGKSAMRRNLAQASKLIDQAESKLEQAHRLVAGDPHGRKFIRGSLDSLNPKTPEIRYGASKHRSPEYLEAVDAASRRNGRGDGYGEA